MGFKCAHGSKDHTHRRVVRAAVDHRLVVGHAGRPLDTRYMLDTRWTPVAHIVAAKALYNITAAGTADWESRGDVSA